MTLIVGIDYTRIDEKDKNMVGIFTNGESTGMTPTLARHIAVDLMIWADRLDPPEDIEEDNDG